MYSHLLCNRWIREAIRSVVRSNLHANFPLNFQILIYHQEFSRQALILGCHSVTLSPILPDLNQSVLISLVLIFSLRNGIHINLWLIHVNIWQKPLQYCKVISLQLIKINRGKKRNEKLGGSQSLSFWCVNRTELATLIHKFTRWGHGYSICK